jgi:hypothetical protein
MNNELLLHKGNGRSFALAINRPRAQVQLSVELIEPGAALFRTAKLHERIGDAGPAVQPEVGPRKLA